MDHPALPAAAAAGPTVRRVARLVAGGFGLGRVPVAPGTAASAAAVLAGAALLAAAPWALPVAVLAAALLGVFAIVGSGVTGDPGWVVIDEIAGQWIALLALPRPAPLWLLAAFGLFRALDVAKPGPVGWADRRRGAAWVMADDVIAGALAAALLLAARAVVR
jgi:phosphatidylglycerophosphatase A